MKSQSELAVSTLIGNIEEQFQSYRRLGLLSDSLTELVPSWRSRVDSEPSRFIGENGLLNLDAIQNFRKRRIFLSDVPIQNPTFLNPANIILGGLRGARKTSLSMLETLESNGFGDLLRKYPCDSVGHPYTYTNRGFRFTQRWLKHIYFLGLFNRFLLPKLKPDFVAMDIGCSYSIFSRLLKSEYPASRHILVDSPEQLLLAHYYLGSCFPNAKIAVISELPETGTVSRKFVQDFDFVLVPPQLYARIAPGSVDVVTNFTSFGEMGRSWFEHYVNSPSFTTAQYFFTSNRFHRKNSDHDELDILDYPIWDTTKKLHFAVCPIWSSDYRRNLVFMTNQVNFPPHFEYIGEI